MITYYIAKYNIILSSQRQQVVKISALIALIGVILLIFGWLVETRLHIAGGTPFSEKEFFVLLFAGIYSSALLLCSVIKTTWKRNILLISLGIIVVIISMLHEYGALRHDVLSFLGLDTLFIKTSYISEDGITSYLILSLGLSSLLSGIGREWSKLVSDFSSLSVLVSSFLTIGTTIASIFVLQQNAGVSYQLLSKSGLFLFIALAMLFVTNSNVKIAFIKRFGAIKFNLKELSMNAKLLFSYGILIIMLTTFATITHSSINSIKEDLIDSRESMSNAEILLWQMDKQSKEFLNVTGLTPTSHELKPWHAEYLSLQENIESVQATLEPQQYHQELNFLLQAKRDITSFNNTFLNTLGDTPNIETRNSMEKTIVEAEILISSVRSSLLQNTNENFNGLRNFLILASSLFIVSGVYFALSMGRRISTPLLLLQHAANLIKQGKKYSHLPLEYKDEIGDLAKSFDAMTKKLVSKNSELIKANQRNSTILEHMGDGVIAVDERDNILFMNNEAAHILHCNPESLIGKKSISHIALSDHLGNSPTKSKNPLIHQGTSTLQWFVKNNTKKPIPVSITVDNLMGVNCTLEGRIIVLRDITKEHEIDRAKTEFVSLASHQLRTPLSTIKWYIEMLLEQDAGKVNQEQQKLLEEAYLSSDRMTQLVTALLNVSKIELGTFGDSPEKFNLSNEVHEIAQEMDSFLKKKHIKLTIKISKKLTLYMDVKILRIIIGNIITNSIKYSKQGGHVSIKANKIIKGRKIADRYAPANSVLFTISDDGLGIPKPQQSKVFTKLFRADNAKAVDTDGTGLGLYITKSLVDKIHGHIWFISREKRGTTFYITIPYHHT